MFYTMYLSSVCQRRQWPEPYYSPHRVRTGHYHCTVRVNNREYSTEVPYATESLARDGAAQKAYMICRNFSVNDGMIPGQRPGQRSEGGKFQGLPVAIGTGRGGGGSGGSGGSGSASKRSSGASYDSSSVEEEEEEEDGGGGSEEGGSSLASSATSDEAGSSPRCGGAGRKAGGGGVGGGRGAGGFEAQMKQVEGSLPLPAGGGGGGMRLPPSLKKTCSTTTKTTTNPTVTNSPFPRARPVKGLSSSIPYLHQQQQHHQHQHQQQQQQHHHHHHHQHPQLPQHHQRLQQQQHPHLPPPGMHSLSATTASPALPLVKSPAAAATATTADDAYLCYCRRAAVRAYGRCAWCLRESGWA